MAEQDVPYSQRDVGNSMCRTSHRDSSKDHSFRFAGNVCHCIYRVICGKLVYGLVCSDADMHTARTTTSLAAAELDLCDIAQLLQEEKRQKCEGAAAVHRFLEDGR
ncbi:unnamed protein product [Pleuronectes platessa]|uniref:Uncharacterized protein n=1 Tax=Pleuronectes platessa TaxID=8262 RepID=A0A9N7YG67_PLEPL|nr:unnamed protein product [Pleuronectes platessa]